MLWTTPHRAPARDDPRRLATRDAARSAAPWTLLALTFRIALDARSLARSLVTGYRLLVTGYWLLLLRAARVDSRCLIAAASPPSPPLSVTPFRYLSLVSYMLARFFIPHVIAPCLSGVELLRERERACVRRAAPRRTVVVQGLASANERVSERDMMVIGLRSKERTGR